MHKSESSSVLTSVLKNEYLVFRDYFEIPVLVIIIMRWTGHVARVGRTEAHSGLWWGT
jgi:hypothetical protein